MRSPGVCELSIYETYNLLTPEFAEALGYLRVKGVLTVEKAHCRQPAGYRKIHKLRRVSAI